MNQSTKTTAVIEYIQAWNTMAGSEIAGDTSKIESLMEGLSDLSVSDIGVGILLINKHPGQATDAEIIRGIRLAAVSVKNVVPKGQQDIDPLASIAIGLRELGPDYTLVVEQFGDTIATAMLRLAGVIIDAENRYTYKGEQALGADEREALKSAYILVKQQNRCSALHE